MLKQYVLQSIIMRRNENDMSSKERYLSKEEYKRYERLKADIKGGRLLNPEGLLYLAESVSIATAAVEPGAPIFAIPSALRISPTLSPTVGVGASERSTIPNS